MRKCLLSSRFGFRPFKALKAISFLNLKSYFRRLSHVFIITGFMMKYRKYRLVAICPIMMYGLSTGRPPIHVITNHDLTSNQNIICLIG